MCCILLYYSFSTAFGHNSLSYFAICSIFLFILTIMDNLIYSSIDINGSL